MTDTGQVPGEGLPESAGMVEQPGVTAHGAYTYLSETTAEDEDLLLLPGAQSPWGNEVAPPAPEPVVEAVHEPGPHETAGRDSGSVDLGGVRLPNPAPAPAPVTPRRPLHLGPPIPDASASPVRSLADRGPAGAPVRHAGPPTVGPEYLDTSALHDAAPLPATPWTSPSVAPEAPAAETVVPPQDQHAEPVGAAQAVMTRITAEAGVPARAAEPGADGQVDFAHAGHVGDLAHGGHAGQGGEGAYGGQAAEAAGSAEYGSESGQAPQEAVAVQAAEAVVSADGEVLEGVEPGSGPGSGLGPDAVVADSARLPDAADVAPADAAVAAPAAEANVFPPAPDAPQPLAAGAAGVEVDAPAIPGEAPAVPDAPHLSADPTPAAPQPLAAGHAPDTAVTPTADQQGLAPESGPAAAGDQPELAPQSVGTPAVDESGLAPEPAVAPVGDQPELASQAVVTPARDQPGFAPEPVLAAAGDQPGPAPDAGSAAAGDQPELAPQFVGTPAVDESGLAPEPAVAPAGGQPVLASEAAVTPTPDQPGLAPEAAVTPTPDEPGLAPEAAVTPTPDQPGLAPQVGPHAPASDAPEQPVAVPAEALTEVAPEMPEAALTDAPSGPTAEPVSGIPADALPGLPAEPLPGLSAEPLPGLSAEPLGETPTAAPGETSTAPGDAPAETLTEAPAEILAEAGTDPTTRIPAAAEAGAAPAAPAPAVAEADIDPAAPTPAAAPTPSHPEPPTPVGQFVPVEGTVPTTPHLAPTPPHPLTLPPEEEPAAEGVVTVPAPRDADTELVQHAEDLDTRAADQEESTAAVEEVRQSTGPAAPAYDEAEREAVMKVMRERRDIRNGFRGDPIPHEVLLRVLEAAHTAPSVGHSQPWDFVVIRSADTRRSMHELAMRQRDAYAKSLPKGRAKQFKELKIEAILDTPVNIVVTADPTRGGRHTLGRHTQPQMAPYSAALAVENLWLAARAEGLGVGWVSFFDEREMVRALGLPEHLEVIAYLCVGYVDEFPEEPELMQAGWSKRRPLSWVVHEETYGRRALPGEDPHDLLAETVAQIRPLDAKALGEAWERQKRMTKPAGALGMLEIISAQLSGLSRQCPPPIPEPAAVAIFAGDHGVHAQGVTPWPQEVTAQMVANFLGGGAVCNAFAGQVGAEVCVVDVGVAAELPATPGLLPRKVRAGTSDMTTGPAMTREEAKQAIEVGIETARDLVAAGNKALLTGEMGIANTTASAALISVFTDTDPAEVTGRGTGINDETLARKTEVVRRAIELHQPDPADPIGVLAAIGGFEHAAIVGLLLGGASLRTPVILDGVSAGAAALVARAIAPEVLAACIAGHRSAEPGHVAALNKLGLRPLVDLDLRLGEGTGALLALPLVQSTARAMHEVATFDSAGVTEK
ncbi:nicotinate-nucleotide--dimethylbenzimidazole phosphoribosyltransferase [Streptomyces cylindrosporus]|uniref:Nicotinate-nucleotide--dimethylbenzimidazole phosphoribosyltransferase n=1 Tax=Streptomyces cylindrosporus TaxID=2927583 RepID=A0ABS9YF54_9ACTN|nr:nicotinate-nucleotide--dimethylbenzimidazole phosphoribosyltransferase [Streptomyces cylindrosporus]MCI3275857.1 nicotinate-nucleotide--dimethylbenzimidazole phosphoribosyltransferase [Streptomyces cylindrosporus]